MLAARFATPFLVGDDQRVLVQHSALDAGPGTHIDADLLAHEAAKDKGRRGQHADGGIGNSRGSPGHHGHEQCWCVGKIEDPGAAGGDGDHQPD